MLWDPLKKIRKLFVPYWEKKALRYLEDEGVLELILDGREDEIKPIWFDLYNMHKIIRERKPATVLEFGIGFSTIVMAHALERNKSGHLWSIDTSQEWIKNLEQKLPDTLRGYVTIQQSDVQIAEHEGQLCHYYETLPDIVPDFVYLDGPSTADVKGSVRGLTFQPHNTRWRNQVAADLLLYEASLHNHFFLLVDGRKMNVEFLYRNLKRRYRVRQNHALKFATFELLAPR